MSRLYISDSIGILQGVFEDFIEFAQMEDLNIVNFVVYSIKRKTIRKNIY